MRHDLESGAWIDIRPLQDLKSRDRDVFDDANAQVMGISASYAGDGDISVKEIPFAPAQIYRIPRRALLCRLLNSWSYEGLELPRWAGGIENEASFGEIPIDDENEIYALLDPYVTKIEQKPDPKGRRAATTTKSSSGSKATPPPGSRPA